jgi:hypothetical protein
MIRHCVTLTFSSDATAEQVHAVLDGLATLPGAIPEIRSYSFGRDLALAEGNASMVVVGDFDDVAGYLVYRDHPAHQKVIVEAIRPILAGRSAVQYEH